MTDAAPAEETAAARDPAAPQGWSRLLELGDLEEGRPRVVKRDRHQLAVIRTGDAVFAVDNRCPHEGYPLASGELRDGVLTCAWHNWKFRLCDGVCVLGGEDVASYPVRVVGGAVWADLADRPSADLTPRLYRALDNAFDEDDWARAARTVERLRGAGECAEEVLGHGAAWAAARAPYGFDHGPAAAADLATLAVELPESSGILLLEALELIVSEHVRRPAKPWPAPEAAAGADWRGLERELRRRVEAEEEEGAIALLGGGIAAGASPREVFRWIGHAASDHFLDYGHAEIFCVKAEELLARIGWRHAPALLGSLVRAIVLGTREDRLPYMKRFVAAAPDPERRAAWGARPARADASWDVDGMLAAILDGSLDDALAATAAALDAGVAADRIALGLALAAAQRLLRFDAGLEHRDDVGEGWLDVTHALTYADAVREALRRRPSADALRGLFYGARFVQHMAPLDRAPAPASAEAPASAASPAEQLAAAVLARDPAGATAAARAALAAGLPAAGQLCRIASTRDLATRPIFFAHHVKVTMAARRLAAAIAADPLLGPRGDRDAPVLAAARFLAAPLQERRIARGAQVAHAFVRDGRRQERLLGY